MRPSIRTSLLASSLLVGVTSTVPAWAQATGTGTQANPARDTQQGDTAQQTCAQNPTAAGCANDGQTVTITGSRIPSPTLVAPSPLQVIDSQDIANSGQINLASIVNENPTISSPALTRTNSNFLTSGAGIASVSLRNLGTARTLVLINGHRTVAGIPNTNLVDFNTIPSSFVERVDVLTGGASSLYGSDAMAGVVNIIYKDSFEGLRLSAQSGVTSRGDGGTQAFDATLGANFGDGRGNVMAYIGYTKEDPVYSSQRPNLGADIDQNACYQIVTAQGGCQTAVATGDYTDLFTAYRPFYSSFIPNSTVQYGPAGAGQRTSIVGPGGTLIPVNTNGLVHVNDGVSATVRPCTNADPCRPTVGAATGFNRNAFRTIAVPVERYLIALRGTYQLTDGIQGYMEGNFARSSVTTRTEPFAFQTSGVNGTAPNACVAGTPQTICGGFHPIETRLANGTVVRNPFVPDAIYNFAVDRTGDGLRDVAFTRRLTDFGVRTYTAERTTFRVLGGFKGRISDNWEWDVFFGYGQTVESQVGSGQVNLNNFTNALEVIPGPNGPQCASAVARAQGCVPVNIFAGGGQGFSPGAVTYIQAATTRNAEASQTIAGASIAGSLIELWDGPLGVALGVEYRRESSSSRNDPLTTAGLNGGNALQPTQGSFDLKEAYAEVAIPLLADRPFFHNLTVRAAGRISDYSLTAVGTVYSWNLGLEYAPIRDIRFRIVRANAARAPNIGELFGGVSQTFPTGLVDPCTGVTAVSTTAASAQCRLDQGVLNNIATNGAFTLNQADLQGISGFQGGTPTLSEETGKTFTAGVVINPTSINALRNLVFTADYFNIRLSNLISAYGRQTILNNCYQQQDPVFCALITRRQNPEGPNSAGSLQFVNSFQGNIGSFQTSGMDFTLSYRQNLASWGLGSGTLTTRIAYTRVFVYKDPNSATNQAGEEATPWDKASGSITYDQRSWGMTFRGNFIGRSYLPFSFTGVVAGTPGSEPFRIPAYFTMDAQVRFSPSERFEFALGATNLFDADPPPLISGLPGGNTGVETDAATYDAIGRRFYARAILKF